MKKTHINSRRSEMLLNAILVQSEYGYSTQEYNEFIFNLGTEFLSVVYPDHLKTKQNFSNEKSYWNWWRNVFFNWEKELIEFFQEHKVPSDKTLFEMEMKVLAHDRTTEVEFQTYVKLYKPLKNKAHANQ